MFEGMTPPSKDKLCLLGSKSADLAADDLAVLTDALADPRWIAEDLAAELSKRGFKISTNVIRKHRKGTCACAK